MPECLQPEALACMSELLPAGEYTLRLLQAEALSKAAARHHDNALEATHE